MRGTTGRHLGPLDPIPSRPGRMVKTAVRPTRTRVACDSWSSPRDIGHSPDLPGTAGRPRVFGPGPEFPGATGRHRWPSDQCPSHPVDLVDHARPSDPGQSRPGQLVDPRVPRTQQRDTRDSCSTPRTLGHGPESPGTAGRPQGPSDTTARHSGQLVNTTGPKTQAPVTRDSWSTQRALGPGPKSPGGAV